MSQSQIATELGLSLPLSINHPWVLLLAQTASLPVSFSDLLGKTGRFDGNLQFVYTGSPFYLWHVSFGNPFFGGSFFDMETSSNMSGNPTAPISLNFNTLPQIPTAQNILVKNNTTNVSLAFGWNISTHTWTAATIPANFITGNNDSFTITLT